MKFTDCSDNNTQEVSIKVHLFEEIWNETVSILLIDIHSFKLPSKILVSRQLLLIRMMNQENENCELIRQ